MIDALYAEALLLADEARAWFDRARGSEEARRRLSPLASNITDDPLYRWSGRTDPSLRVALSCESLRLTTRLMHVIAWLLTQRAVDTGELAAHEAATPARRLGSAPLPEMAVLAAMPARAVALVEASRALYERVERLDAVFDEPAPASSPAHRMIDRLRGAL